MPSFRTGVVTSVLAERRGLQKVEVDGERAYVLTQLIGTVAVGDRVVINTTAVDLALGTGGWHFVHWNLERSSWSSPGPGTVMKLRYTSLQVDTGAAEEDGSSWWASDWTGCRWWCARCTARWGVWRPRSTGAHPVGGSST